MLENKINKIKAKDLFPQQAQLKSYLQSELRQLLTEGSEMELAERARAIVEKLVPVIPTLAAEIRASLEKEEKYVIVEGLGFEYFPEGQRELYMLSISQAIGDVTPTDKVGKKVVWPVRPKNVEGRTNVTFSERTGEAELHTDTSYFPSPERYFGLWVIQPAIEGGTSMLVDGNDAINALLELEHGELYYKILTTVPVPFRVPGVFTKDGQDSTIEAHLAPVFVSYPHIRYRKDGIAKGFQAIGKTPEPEVKAALKAFDAIINDPRRIHFIDLQRGQVLFANNHETLHGRTDFTDVNRFLYRIRMNPHHAK